MEAGNITPERTSERVEALVVVDRKEVQGDRPKCLECGAKLHSRGREWSCYNCGARYVKNPRRTCRDCPLKVNQTVGKPE